MSKHELSLEEQAREFDERCRCESRQPKTAEEKRLAKEHQKKIEEYYEKHRAKKTLEH